MQFTCMRHCCYRFDKVDCKVKCWQATKVGVNIVDIFVKGLLGVVVLKDARGMEDLPMRHTSLFFLLPFELINR